MNMLPVFIRTRIKNKVFASFMIILLLLTAIFTVSHLVVKKLGKASDDILLMNYNSITYAVQMLQEADSIERNAILYYSTKDTLAFSAKIESQSSFAAWLGRSQDNVTELGERQILEMIGSLSNRFIYYIDSLYGSRAEYNPELQEIVDSTREALKTECKNLLDVNQKAMFVKSARAQSIAKQGATTLVLVFVLVLFLGIVMSYGLSTRIVKPIYRLVDATHDIAMGDYTKYIFDQSEDELGILITKFNEMTQKLREFNALNLRAVLEEQQKIQAIFSNINDGIIFIGSDYIIKDANKQALLAFGLENKEVLGHHFLEVLNNEKMFNALKTCLESLQAPELEDKDNYLVLPRDNRELYLQYSFSPVVSRQNELLGALFLLRDLTDMKELDRLKSEFVMIVSHELKTPLTSINMSIDLLRETLSSQLDPSQIELIDIAKEDVLRLRLLVSDLLELSKIEAGKIDLHFSTINLNEMMSSICQNFKTQTNDKNITLEITASADKLPTIKADEDKLLWVFSNLISNAIKAVDDGGKIVLKAERGGKFVLVSVIDDGVGIPLDYQKKIFEKFTQVPGQSSAQGTGLGLMICKEIIRAHGGTIWVESKPGKGSEFVFTVPIANEVSGSIFARDKT